MAPGILADETPSGATLIAPAKEPTNGTVATNGHTAEKKGSETANGEAGTGEKSDEAAKDAEPEAKKDEAEAKKDEAPEDQTMKCEIKHLDRRYDEKDVHFFAERKAEAEKPKQKDWWRLFAFCLVRHYDSDGDLDTTRLYINPQPLRQLMYDVIGYFPGDPIDVDDVQIEAPYHSLFYYRKQLEEQGRERFADDEESLKHLEVLLDWIRTHFALDIAAYDKCLASDHKAMSYDRLWTLFPPEKIIHCKILDQNRAFRVLETWYDDSDDLPGLGMRVNYIDFDGERLGTRKTELFVPKYPGTRELSELPTMPLDLLGDAEEVRAELMARGRKFEGFIGQHYLQYNGIALKRIEGMYAKFTVNGRVMIDAKTYHRLEPNDSFVVKELPAQDEATKRERSTRRKGFGLAQFLSDKKIVHDKLPDEDATLTNATVRGYSFTNKRFLEFFADELFPIEWNTNCFDQLVLDPAVKKTVQALVSTHAQDRESFDDIVKGKGQGLVCVLHGPPGVGKTLTAECVAEYVKRPLYMVSSGDLGVSSTDLDHQLTRIMDMTATWRAVLLIDEADVFLERRSLHDLHRNAMVSVFLRVLEYYSGILFLTTNRVTTFDDAFKSRIHIPIRYTDLSVDSRKQIWRNFCGRVPGGVDIDERGFGVLAEHDLNGRQIKNAIKAAESLAAFDEVKLDLKQLLQITKIQDMFEKDLTNLSGIDYTAPGQSKKDADSRNMFL
ncbi:P-loop containing nucleoside triphosphate hydrolase protein [Lasiosphaeria hispida]|uniref:P-loop containing nucleoside triphosphate hydrolase protein n=1 Tax=Lasiosphaeria hispida TaxID=260671 RepID=A0AAJ0M8K5_9PEZI|nr:P-loop containing nucleoside triphosphate hydrolase protein [Lasiosphaeria hispida]